MSLVKVCYNSLPEDISITTAYNLEKDQWYVIPRPDDDTYRAIELHVQLSKKYLNLIKKDHTQYFHSLYFIYIRKGEFKKDEYPNIYRSHYKGTLYGVKDASGNLVFNVPVILFKDKTYLVYHQIYNEDPVIESDYLKIKV